MKLEAFFRIFQRLNTVVENACVADEICALLRPMKISTARILSPGPIKHFLKIGRKRNKFGVLMSIQLKISAYTTSFLFSTFLSSCLNVPGKVIIYMSCSELEKQIFQPKLLPKNKPTNLFFYPDYLSGL